VTAANGDAIRRELQQEQEDWKWILSDPRGRRAVSRLLDETKLFTECNTGNSGTFFNLGRRRVGLYLLDRIMEAAPDFFARAYQENKAREEESK
jgi:hypothetical protein